MKAKLLAAVSLFACTAAMGNAFADEGSGERWPRWYVGLGGGVSFLDDADLSGSATGNVDFDEGGIGYAALGYRPHFGYSLLDMLRFEIEGAYHSNSLDSATLGGTPVVTSGSLTTWSLMGNMFFDVRNDSRWTPYVGAGAGWADVEVDVGSGLGNVEENDKAFAYQFMAGFSYAPASIPLTEWSLGYRYFALDDPEFATATGSIQLEDAESHNVEIGGRFRF